MHPDASAVTYPLISLPSPSTKDWQVQPDAFRMPLHMPSIRPLFEDWQVQPDAFRMQSHMRYRRPLRPWLQFLLDLTQASSPFLELHIRQFSRGYSAGKMAPVSEFVAWRKGGRVSSISPEKSCIPPDSCLFLRDHQHGCSRSFVSCCFSTHRF